MSELMPCPFCGCNMEIRKDKYPDGSERIEPYGYHEENCILDAVLWCTYPEDEWTEDKLAEAWNSRWERGERQ